MRDETLSYKEDIPFQEESKKHAQIFQGDSRRFNDMEIKSCHTEVFLLSKNFSL